MATEIRLIDEQQQHAAPSRFARLFARFESWLERVVDRINPILVKECRQALKSRQFTITFSLVLGCCWLWSIYGVMAIGPEVHLGAAGMRMYFGYFGIMAFPLLVVVPYGAFRSLADERDDRTFDLLSITALSPRQIVAGKLGSAVMQMLVYLSAITPCLGFTYLLRGIEAPTILITVVYMFFGSLGLSMVGLLAATIARERHWQTLWAAAVVLGLAGLFFLVVGLVTETLSRDRIAYESSTFWIANVYLALAYASYFALCYLAAGAQLTFPSENRSTALRIVMLVQQLLLTFGIVWAIARRSSETGGLYIDGTNGGLIEAYLVILSLHWYAMGVLLNGEMPRLSNRAKRRLPQSFLGRVFFTWFNPGPASGYLFALTNLGIGISLLIGGLVVWQSARGPLGATAIGRPGVMTMTVPPSAIFAEPVIRVTLLAFGYVALYLGLGRLVLSLLRRLLPSGIVISVIVQGLLWLVFNITPVLMDEIAGRRRYEYDLWYVFSPPATFSEIARRGLGSTSDKIILIVLGAALAVFIANLRGIAAELRQVRTEAPQRVIEEEELLHPKPAVVPMNPFE